MMARAEQDPSRSSRRRPQASGLLIALTAATLTPCFAAPAAEQLFARSAESTDHCRELAKNKAPVLVVTSGAKSLEVAESLIAEIRTHKEWNRSKRPDDLRQVSIREAAALALDPKRNDITYLFVIVRNELAEPIPADLAQRIPFRVSELKQGEACIFSAITRTNPLTFSILLCAPDAERLPKVVDAFRSRRTSSYRDLGFLQRFQTNRVAVFSDPEDRGAVEKWGKQSGPNVINSIRWYPLSERAKLSGADLEECNEVYFINRGKTLSRIPPPAAALLSAHPLRPTTVLVKRDTIPDDRQIAVFSAPSQAILHAKATRYDGFGSIPGGLVLEEVRDLRRVQRSTLLVNGAVPNAQDREAIRILIAKTLRDRLKLNVEERGELLTLLQREVTLQELQRGTKTADLLRRQGNLRYIWLFTVVEYAGGTEYSGQEKKVFEEEFVPYERARPDDPEPRPKSVGGGRADELRRLQPSIDAWKRRKANWEESARQNRRADYERTVIASSRAEVRGILRLLDLEDQRTPVEILWEQECRGSAAQTRTHRSDRVSTRGGTPPGSMGAPPNSNECPPELLRAAAVESAREGILSLQESAWIADESNSAEAAVAVRSIAPLPGRAVPSEPPRRTADPDPPRPLASRAGKVVLVDVSRPVVTIDIGQAEGLRLDDRVQIILKNREIRNPANGELIETVIEDSLILRASRVGKTTDCAPIRPQDAARFSDVKPGMPVKWWRQLAGPRRRNP